MPTIAGEWKEYQGGVYRCPVYVIREPGGEFSAVAANLPGVASYGDSEQEALAHVTEALAAALQEYKASGMSIPWADTPAEVGAVKRWVVVNV